MDYTLQTITISTSCGKRDIPALVATGTGLACHPEYTCDGQSTGWHALTHIASGYSLVEYMVESPAEAERWLELVSELADWNKSMAQLKRYKSLPKKIKEAHKQVLRESMISV